MNYRDRIVGLKRVPASQLVPHEKNWRTHPTAQSEALRGVLAEIGWADTIKVRELSDGRMQIVDGHLRQGMDETVPVLVLDLNDEETLQVLATMDPIGAMAETSNAALESLMRDVRFDSAATQKTLGDLARSVGIIQLPGEGENDPDVEWRGMPEFEQLDIDSWKCLKVHFKDAADYQAFQRLIGQTLTDLTRAIWYPKAEIGVAADKRYVDGS